MMLFRENAFRCLRFKVERLVETVKEDICIRLENLFTNENAFHQVPLIQMFEMENSTRNLKLYKLKERSANKLFALISIYYVQNFKHPQEMSHLIYSISGRFCNFT